jgi:hypothetical protein
LVHDFRDLLEGHAISASLQPRAPLCNTKSSCVHGAYIFIGTGGVGRCGIALERA